MNFKRLILIAIIGAGIGWMLVPQPASAAPKAESCKVTDAVLKGGTVSFTNPCNQDLSLVAYEAPSATFDKATAGQQKVYDAKAVENLGAGHYEWAVKLPACYHQVDFVTGPVLRDLSKQLYEGRIIKTETGGQPCSTTTTAPVTTTTAIPDDTQRGEDYGLPQEPVGTPETPVEIANAVTVTNPAEVTELAHTGAQMDRLLRLGSILVVIGSFLGLAAWFIAQRKNVGEGRKARFEK